MKAIKKIVISFVLAFSLLAPVLQITPVAATYDASKMSFEEYVIAHLENFETSINVLPYLKDFNYDGAAITSEVLRIAKSTPELFHVVVSGSNLFKYSLKKTTSSRTGVVTYTSCTIACKYRLTKSEYKKKLANFKESAEKALDMVESDMTDAQKALVLHDYLALTVAYDTAARDASSANKATKYSYAYTAEGALVERSSVCEGYTMAYMYLLDQVGIESAVVRSEEINHAWSYVKLDGKWYHVDVTRDDPLYNGKRDQMGYVSHEYFLITDAELLKLDKELSSKKDWDVYGLPSATSKTYSKAFWKKVETSIQKAGDFWYWVELDQTSPAYNKNYEKLRDSADFNDIFFKMYHNIIKYDPEKNKKTKIYKIDATWFKDGSENKNVKSWWSGSYVRLFIYNDKIYFNTAKEICYVDLNGKNKKTVSKPSLGGKYIYGMRFIDGKIQYTLKSDPSKADSIKTKKI